jgi:hypothetical protein
MRAALIGILLLSLPLLSGAGTPAGGQVPTLLDPVRARQELEATRDRWISFGASEGKPAINFAYLSIFGCVLKEIRYGLNSHEAKHIFPAPNCNKDNPFEVALQGQFLLRLASDDIKRISVQLVFTDGAMSPVHIYEPCLIDEDTACARLVGE